MQGRQGISYTGIDVFQLVSALLMMAVKKKSPRQPTLAPASERCRIEIDETNLLSNAAALQAAMPNGCKLMAVVKDDAYGHGAVRVSRCLNRAGVDAFAVATIDEGIELRQRGVRGEILILGYTTPERSRELVRYRMTQTIVSPEHARSLDEMNLPIRAHLAIDTGMHRLGIEARDVQAVADCFGMPHLMVEGIYTHLCAADGRDPASVSFTRGQIERFYALLDMLRQRGVKVPKVHIQASHGLLNYPELNCDYVRAGIALYGAMDAGAKQSVDLRPVLSLKSQIALIRDVGEGEPVGYGCGFVAGRCSRIAVVTIGYGDGLPRQLSCGAGEVLVRGRRVPIAGRICMDQMMIDVTDVPCVQIGDIVTLIGRDGAEEITSAELAARAQTIPNELLCRLGNRPRRVWSIG